MRRIAAAATLGLGLVAGLAPDARAQEDDRGYLTAFLEDNLSGAGRKITITGFEGALSSRATIERLQIADDAGVWITLDGVVLDWSRSSLLSGEVVINELTAETITLDRMPDAGPAETTPEVTPFALPDLPVSVEIGEISAGRIVLGAPVLGEPVEAVLKASMSLAGGEGKAALDLRRIDGGPEGQVVLDANYSNATGRLDLNLDAREGSGGIAARLMRLPGTPSVEFTLKGAGPLGDFAADLRLATDGAARLAGPITVATDEKGARSFTAKLEGNPAPLFLPAYAEFLGDRLSFDLAGRIWPAGGLRLDRLELAAASLSLSGTLGLAADGLPTDFDLTARIASPDGSAVLLPLSGDVPTRLNLANLALKYDATKGDGWTGHLVAEGLDRSDFAASRAELSGSGRIGRVAGQNSLGGTIQFVAEGLAPADAALATALGSMLTGRVVLHWRQGEDALSLQNLVLAGNGYGLTGGLRLEGLQSGLNTSGRVVLTADDLSRFSALAGRPLGGKAVVRADGSYALLSGAFDLDLGVEAERLVTGIAQADLLLTGPSTLLAQAVRDETGLSLSGLALSVASLRLSGEGKVTSEGTSFDGKLNWGDLSDLGGTYGGSISAEAGFTGTSENGRAMVKGTGQNLRVGQAEVDRLIAGASDFAAEVAIADGAARLAGLTLKTPQVSADVSDAGGGALNVTGKLVNLALIAPEFPGPVSLSGRVRPEGEVLVSELRVSGPAGIDATIAGRIAAKAPDLTVRGTAQAGIANAFTGPVNLAGALGYDLALRGGWALPNLSGRATLSGGSVAIPARGLALDRVAASADLAGGTARITATAEARRGGRLRVGGTVGLTAPYQAGLDIGVDGLSLRDPELFETRLTSSLRLEGPLLGRAQLSGRVNIGETELRIPSTGFATAADLEAVRHVNDGADVRATRARAGVGQGEGGDASAGSSLPDWGLDLTIVAPNRIFLRGRGLDAELGGTVFLGGSLSNVIPSGGLDLIRGRLDILGKRLVLASAEIVLQGSLIPYVTVSASTENDGVTSYVVIDGPADAPQVNFSSVPDLPQEEVLSHLLFGRGLDTISAFQAAQLANAVAVLAGKGGEGVVGKLRKGFGFDDLDVSTDDSGSAAVKAGKYISKNLYTEFSLGQDGTSRINLNLDVRKGVTVKGRVDSDGESGIGIFLERDY